MKQFYLKIWLILLSVPCLSQVYNGNVHLKNQAEITEAFSKGGELEKITTINGFLYIGDRENGSDITSIKSLSKIKNIRDGLYLLSNLELKSLEGLESIISLSNLKISANIVLEDLQGLKNLKNITESFRIAHCSLLKSYEGLTNLQMVKYAEFYANANVLSFKGLENLKKATEIEISDHNKLQNIADLKIKTIGTLVFRNNDELQSLHGLESITSIGHLKIIGNDSLKSLVGLEKIENFSDGIFIYANKSLTSLKGLHNLKSTGEGDLSIYGNKKLASLEALENLTKIEGILQITENHNLKNLNGLHNIKSVGHLDIYFNNNLQDFCAIKSVFKDKTKVSSNEYNPTKIDIDAGKCSKY